MGRESSNDDNEENLMGRGRQRSGGHRPASAGSKPVNTAPFKPGDQTESSASGGDTNSNHDDSERLVTTNNEQRATLRRHNVQRNPSIDDTLAIFPIASFAISEPHNRKWVSFLGSTFLGWKNPHADLYKQTIYTRAGPAIRETLDMAQQCKIMLSDLLQTAKADGDKKFTALGRILQDIEKLEDKMIDILNKNKENIVNNAAFVRRTIADEIAEKYIIAKNPGAKENIKKEIESALRSISENRFESIKSLPFDECRSRDLRDLKGDILFDGFFKTHVVGEDNAYKTDQMYKAALLQEKVKFDAIVASIAARRKVYEGFRNNLQLNVTGNINNAEKLMKALQAKFSYMKKESMLESERAGFETSIFISHFAFYMLVERFETLWCSVYVFFQSILGRDDEKINKLTTRFVKAVIYSSMSHLFALHNVPRNSEDLTLKELDNTDIEAKIKEAFKRIHESYEAGFDDFFATISALDIWNADTTTQMAAEERESFIKKISIHIHEDNAERRLKYTANASDLKFDNAFSVVSENVKKIFTEKLTQNFSSIPARTNHGKKDDLYVRCYSNEARDVLIGEVKQMLDDTDAGKIIGFAISTAHLYDDPAFAALISTQNFQEVPIMDAQSNVIGKTRLDAYTRQLYEQWKHPFGHLIKPTEKEITDQRTADKEALKKITGLEGIFRPTWIIHAPGLTSGVTYEKTKTDSIFKDTSCDYFKLSLLMIKKAHSVRPYSSKAKPNKAIPQPTQQQKQKGTKQDPKAKAVALKNTSGGKQGKKTKRPPAAAGGDW